MIDRLFASIAPHHCYNCQKTGTLLCDSCKYDIVDEAVSACIVCAGNSMDGICGNCKTHYEKAWMIGSREGTLSHLIDDYKFERVKSVAKVAADLLDARIDLLPPNTAIVPVPTIPGHIRQRGYDHAALIAKSFAKLRGHSYQPVLQRTTTAHQRGASRTQRFEQASKAFQVTTKLQKDTPYLLIDDILTTGATMEFAALALRNAGATNVWVAILARQPLDKAS